MAEPRGPVHVCPKQQQHQEQQQQHQEQQQQPAGRWCTLPEQLLSLVWRFLGPGHFLHASCCKAWRASYATRHGTATSQLACLVSRSQLRWAFKLGATWTAEVAEHAAATGNLVALQSAQRRNFLWQGLPYGYAEWFTHGRCGYGQRRVWCQAPPLVPSLAAAVGKCYHEHGLSWRRRGSCIASAAAASAQLGVLEWAWSQGADFCGYATLEAVHNGHVEVLEWARVLGRVPLLAGVVDEAIRSGHLQVLQWLCNWRYPIDRTAAPIAASLGRVDMLQCLREAGCPWDALTCQRAAEGGHLEALQFARANGCDWDGSVVCTSAAYGRHLHILEWAHAHGALSTEHDRSVVCSAAARNGHLCMLQWARDHGFAWDWRTYRAARSDEVRDWLRARGCPTAEHEFVPGPVFNDDGYFDVAYDDYGPWLLDVNDDYECNPDLPGGPPPPAPPKAVQKRRDGARVLRGSLRRAKQLQEQVRHGHYRGGSSSRGCRPGKGKQGCHLKMGQNE